MYVSKDMGFGLKSYLFIFNLIELWLKIMSCMTPILWNSYRASPVVQWLGVRLPVQGTRVRSLVQEDPTCHGATKFVCHNCWACALEPVSHNYWARMPQLLRPARLEPVLRNGGGRCSGRPVHRGGEWPPLATAGEGPRAAAKTQRSQR